MTIVNSRTKSFLTIIILLLSANAVADFLSPFADSPVGKTVTSNGWLLIASSSNDDPRYLVLYGTDTGLRLIRAEVPKKLIKQEIIGRRVIITAKIKETKAEPNNIPKRYLKAKTIRLLE